MRLNDFPASRVGSGFCCQNEAKMMNTGVDNEKVTD